MWLRPFILVLSCVDLTLILVPPHRLRIMALLSSGFTATVDGAPNVHSSSTIHDCGRVTSLASNCTFCNNKVESLCICGQLKVIPLFQYTSLVPIPRPAFRRLQYRKVGEGLVSFLM